MWLYIDVIPGERPDQHFHAQGERRGKKKKKKKNSENGKSSDDFAICFGHEAVDAHAQYGSESATRCT